MIGIKLWQFRVRNIFLKYLCRDLFHMDIKRSYNLPEPTLRRLLQIRTLLRHEQALGKVVISSTKIGQELGVEAHTIRKDINLLGGAGDAPTGYNIDRLLDKINQQLKLGSTVKACIIGVGRLGEALINYPQFHANGIHIAAAFDVNINKLETLKTDIPLYPAYDMEEVIRTNNIELAILAVPQEEVDHTIYKISKCGIKGILNYTGAILPAQIREGIFIRNLDINSELNILKAMIAHKNKIIEHT